MFFMNVDKDLAIAQIQKAGSATMVEWLGPEFRPIVDNETAKQVSVRVAFFRHPLERLRSCYSMLYWLQQRNQKHGCGAPSDSWENFIDYTFANENNHWMPQVDHVGDTPTIYHRFENIIDHWEKYLPGILPHNNAMTRRPTTDYRGDEIIKKYAADLDIWDNSK